MKSFLRVCIILFSIVVIALACVTILNLSGRITPEMVTKVLGAMKLNSFREIFGYSVSAIGIVLGIMAIVCSDSLKSETKGGIILPAEQGSVHISNQTFENIAINVAKKYNNLKTNRVIIKTTVDGVSVDIYAYVLQNAIISEITEKIQQDIKDAVSKQTTVNVTNVNIKIKGVYELNDAKANS